MTFGVDAGGSTRILIAEDNPRDAELALMELRRAARKVEYVVARDEPELRAALEQFDPEVVLCDFSFPGMDGVAALRIIRERRPEAAIILVTGTITEQQAVLALKNGAVDYVLKSSLIRLPSAVDHAVREIRERKELQTSLSAAQLRIRRHAQRLEGLWRIANDPSLRGQDRIAAMLREAAAGVRLEQRFVGLLARVEGDEIVAVASTATEDPRFHLGIRLPITATVAALASHSQYWDDMSTAVYVPDMVAERGWRAVISTQFLAADGRYYLTFASTRAAAVPFGSEDISYIEVIAASFANQIEFGQLTQTLRESDARSRQQAERLEALWRVANDPGLRDAELWLAMLDEAARSMRPGRLYRAWFHRVDGDSLVVEAVIETPEDPLPGLEASRSIGHRNPLHGTIAERALKSEEGTFFCGDLPGSSFESEASEARGWRSVIASSFAAAGAQYVLLFGDTESTEFGPQDSAYVKMLGSFFSRHVQERWQYDRLAYQQSHDVLTGLLNRSQFRSRARSASLEGRSYAIVLVDVNALHEINDSYGHMIGDALLVEVAAALRQRTAGAEIVGRVAGDVFAVYLPEAASDGEVLARAQHFAEAFSHAFSTGDRAGREFIALGASFGVAIGPAAGSTFDEVLTRADAALTEAKKRGPGAVALYAPGMEGDSQQRAALRSDLIAAVAADEFVLHLQPHVDIHTGAVTGCEALIRWNHPTRGLLLPNQFIPFAEQTGIISGIDSWVMRTALNTASDLGRERPGFRLFFNLSGRQASDVALIRSFEDAVGEGYDMECVGVEITETDAMRDVEATRKVCQGLRTLGVHIAIDDFGVGYSSLSSLKRLPVDIVKIDRSFMSGVIDDPQDETIADTIIAISERFGLSPLAEGIEREEEVHWLRKRPCRIAQGYHFSHPMPIPEFKAWLAERSG